MKKYIFSIIIMVGLATLFNACTDLEEIVYTEIISEEFEPSEEDVIPIIGPAYTSLRNFYFGWHSYFDSQEECSDVSVTPVRPNGWDDGGVYKRMHRHIWTSTQSHVGGIWGRCYTGINNANRALYQIESGILPIPLGKENIIAELKAIRAFYYYILCDNFGNVPIVTRFDVEEGYLPEQNTRQEVYDFVISELTSNIDLLTEVVDQSTYGRLTKWGAKAILAKMYLNAGVYTGTTTQWTSCIAVCDDIIASGKYILAANYNDNFVTYNENCPELIFTVPYDEIYASWFHLHMKTLHPANQQTYNISSSPWGGSCAIPQFIDTYDPDDSRIEDTWLMGLQFSATGDTLYCTMDPALANTPLEFTNFLQSTYETEEFEGYRLIKYEPKIGALGQLSNDFVIFRYADVLMMKAECLLRNGDANAAAALVTQVRQRAFIDNPGKATVSGAELSAGSSYNYGLVENGVIVEQEGGDDIVYGRFLDELGWEFAIEARRRQDLIRFGVFTTKKWLSHEPNGDYRTIFPIPERQLESNPNLTQNPGY
ncbi:MAG: RagB/SusD family nutrient uptake outer membrane protein [Bacteroidales bacterium]|nr:RagB/SusD family nutrient uptake outer membrane protein [Bacteroidales bacterium]